MRWNKSKDRNLAALRLHLKYYAGAAAMCCALASVACAEDSVSSVGGRPCTIMIRSAESQIRLQTSMLTCARARPIVSVLAGTVSTQTVTTEATSGSMSPERWRCRVYPRSALPREVICRNGDRQFEVKALTRVS